MSRPSLFKPAAARIIASYSPDFNLSILVPTLPLSDFIVASGYICFIWIFLLKLLVPMILPAPIFPVSFLLRITSLLSSLKRTAPRQSPSASSIGTSFALWTAISIVLSSSFSSISFVKTPLPPISPSGLSRTLSPCVTTWTISIFSFGKYFKI